jgi:hypothetical protein
MRETLISSDAIFNGGLLRLAEWNLLEQPQEMCFSLQQLCRRGLFRHVEITLGAGHAVLVLFKEIVRTEPVAEIIELPRLACGASVAHNLLVNEHLDGAKVAGEVPASA